jgi:hypothetical protein
MDTESTDSEPADEDLLCHLSSDPAAFEVFYRRTAVERDVEVSQAEVADGVLRTRLRRLPGPLGGRG